MKHIDEKDKVDDATYTLGLALRKTVQELEETAREKLLTNTDKDIKAYTNSLNRSNKDFKQEVNKILAENKKALKNELSSNTKDLKLTVKQKKVIDKEIDNSFKTLYKTSILKQSQNVASITKSLKTGATDKIIQLVARKVDIMTNDGYVVYSNGRKYRWESYLEMKTRTELHKDLTDNLIDRGNESGVVFYICSTYGDCAKDHVDMQQQSIFYDEDWESICPKKYLEDVRAWIDSHKSYLSVQQAKGAEGLFFTTRPNCRHFFQYISIEEVIGFKDDKDVKQYQQEHDMAFKGKYNSDKYEALKKQRYNERYIRALKNEISAKKDIINATSDKDILVVEKAKLSKLQSKLRDSQKAQRKLIKDNPHLQREYKREDSKSLVKEDLYK